VQLVELIIKKNKKTLNLFIFKLFLKLVIFYLSTGISSLLPAEPLGSPPPNLRGGKCLGRPEKPPR
jgi:hypothetical protein